MEDIEHLEYATPETRREAYFYQVGIEDGKLIAETEALREKAALAAHWDPDGAH